jgi:RNA polymerase sigma-70 factor, ECF subfamily
VTDACLTPIDSLSAAGDRAAFVDLLDAHGGSLLALLRRLCRHEQNAEDMFQETAARVWRNFAERPRLTNPRGWLMTIGYRVFLDHRKRMQAQEPVMEAADTRHGSPDSLAERNENAARIQAAIAKVPQSAREILTLHYTAGMTLREVASAMNIAEGTVKSRLNSALNQLRGLLA